MYCVRVPFWIAPLLLIAGLGLARADEPGHPAFMMVAGLTTQPVGHHDLCKRIPIECKERSGDDAPVHLTLERWNQLIAVNDNVNTAIIPDTDEDNYHVEE